MPLPALGAKLLGVRKMLAKVPTWLWIALAVVLLGLVGAWWHGNKVEAFGDERFAEGRASRDAEIEGLRKQINQRNAELAAALRSKHDDQIRRNAADADALRLHGPGRAACSGASYIPAAAGGHVGPGRPADAAVGTVPDGERIELIGLPFAPTVSFAEQHDNFRTEAISWREWHKTFTAEWEAYKAKADAAQPPP